MNLEAINNKLAEIEAENQSAAAAAAQESESAWDRINNAIASVISPDAVRQAMGETYGPEYEENPTAGAPLGTIEDVVGGGIRDFSQAITDANQARLDFIHQGADLQDKYQQAQETGDYSAFSEQVNTLQESGSAASQAMANIAAAPFRQAARNFILNNVNDNTSPYQPMAESLQKTDVALEYFMTDGEKVQKAREIEERTGIPASAILHDNDAFRAAADVYDYMKKESDMETVWATYPEIKGIADLDTEAAVVALHNMDDVRKTHGVVDAFMTFLEKGSEDLEYNNIQYKIMNGEATEEERKRAAELEEKMRADKKEAPGFFQAPLESMAAGVAQSLPEMGQGLVGGGAGAIAATTAAVALTIMTGGGDLVAAGAVAGARSLILRALATQTVKNAAKGGLTFGMTLGMARPETGRSYADMSAEKRADGTDIWTEDEKRLYAPLRGYTNAFLETLNLSMAGRAVGIYPFAEKVFAQNVEKIVTQTTGRETLQMLATDKAKDFAKLTLSESGEEFAQSVADDIIVNAARDNKGAEAAELGTYSAGDILRRGVTNFIESLPASMGFGIAGVSVGAVTGAGRLARARKRAAAADTEAERQQQETMTGGMLVEQLQHAVKEGSLQKVAPDVQRKIIQEQLKDTGYENSYIDVEMALRDEKGRENLQKVAEAQGMSAEELEEAISVNGFIPVSTETLCQVDASPTLLESVSFSPEAESLARMQENARTIAEEYSKNLEKTLERQQALIDTVISEYIPGATKAQKEALQGAVYANPQNPAQGWNAVYSEYKAELDEILQPAIKALQEGMGKAGIMDVEDEQGNTKTIRYTENDEWYREFYRKNKRQPTKAELEDMAIALVTGDPSAPKVPGWEPDSAEMQAGMEQARATIENLQARMAELNSVKSEVKKLTGVEMEITEGLSPEGYKVYRAISSWTEKAGGKVARQGRMAAILVARHADIVARIVSEKTEKKYTAEDYIRERVGFQLVESGQDFAVELQQMAGENAANALHNKLEIAKFMQHTWGKGTLEMRERDAAEMPKPHGVDGHALVVFGGQETSMASGNSPETKAAIFFQRAWHGTPHDFAKFDLGAIGSGEGAQLHGWGLYFAANRKVSEGYQKRLNGWEATITRKNIFGFSKEIKIKQDEYTYDNRDRLLKGDEDFALQTLVMFDFDSQDALKFLKENFPNRKEAAKIIEENRIKHEWNKGGKLYEVDVPEDDVLLDEQASFKQQPEKVKEALKKLVSESESAKKHPAFAEQIYKSKGKKIYNIICGLAEGDAPKGADLSNVQRLGAELLNKYGIKGITYEGGQDGRCYVVFDDQAVEIIEKFNQEANGQTIKGGIAPDPQTAGRHIISILETADESTFMHEMAHMFLFDLEDLAKLDETSAKELEIVNQWAEWRKGAAQEYKGTAWEQEFARREQAIIDAEAYGLYDEVDRLKYEWKQERFARAFEIYLKDGEAPARGLRAIFRKFKQFLRVIYQAFVGDGGRASEPVRRVMDRMIATEDEIEAAALEDRYNDVVKAGGENLFTENEEQTLARWLDEAKEEAKEKVSKIVMADLEKEQQEEFQRQLDEEEEQFTHQLRQENVHIARRALETIGDKEIVLRWFNSIEEFEKTDKATPTLETLVKEHMDDYRVKLDREQIDAHLSPETVNAVMQGSIYQQKIEAYVLKVMEKKKALINRINVKARRAMDSIEEKLKALPDDIDMQVDKLDPTVQDVMKEVNRLRFAGKWTTSDINHIEAMLRASTQAQVRDAIKALKEKQQTQAQQQRDISEVTKGKEKFYREQVRRITETQPMTETCNIRYYLDKERQAGRRVQTMLRAGNWDMAVQQQQQKFFYSMMVKQARENKEEKDRMIRDLERKAKARTVRLPKDERYWFNHLLYLMRIAKTDIKEPEGGARKLDALFDEQRNSLDMLYTPEALLEISNKGENYGDYQQMSLREFRDVYQDLTRLYNIGQYKFRMKTVDGKDIEDVLREIVGDESAAEDILTVVRKITPDTGGLGYIEALGNMGSTGDSVAEGIQQYTTSILKPENIIKLLGKKAHKYIYGTLEKAAEKEAKLSAANLEALREICGMYTHEERQAWDKEIYDFGPAKGRKISKENIICMALNWGTEINRQRLLGGLIADGQLKTETSEQAVWSEVRALFSEHMTKKDWEFVQALWDHMDTFWPETAATEEKLNGVALEKVQPSRFEIQTKEGEIIKLRGGYMPIKYDPDKSARAEEQEIEDTARSMMGAARMGTGRSFTKGRSEYNIYRPLRLNFGVVEQHLQDVIHNIAFRVPLRDVYRLLHYNNFKDGLSMEEYLRRTLGIEAYRNIDQWALDAWKTVSENRNSAESAMKRFGSWLRGSSTLSIMGYRLWPCVENVSNIAIGMDKLGAGNMLAALLDFYSAPQENMKKVRDLSIFMRGRAENLDRDIRSQPGVFHADNKLIEMARNHAYDLMVYSDLMTSAPIWLRAFKDAFEPKIQEVKEENDENIKKRLELAGKVDAVKGAINDHMAQSDAINDFMRARRYGTPQEVAALSDSEYSGKSDGELQATWGQHQKEARNLRRDLWKAETELQKALELPVWDESEIVEEAQRRAAMEADGAIRDTFGSGRNIDLPAVMRSRNEFVRLFTAFYGFFNTQYNALYMAYMESKHLPPEGHIFKWAPLAKAALYRVALTSLIGSSLAFGLGLQGDDKKDKEETVTGPDGKKTKVEVPAMERFLKVWAKNMISVTTGGLYGVRDLMGIAADMVISGNARDYGLGSVVTRSMSEALKTIQLLGKKGEKDAEIQAQQEKKEREHQEKLQKLKGKKRQEYLKKWEEEQRYKKPPQRTTYAEIAGHAGKALSAATAAKTGITSTGVNAVTATMQYMLDNDQRFDASLKNILWSATFDKKPVEREIPKKPEKPKEDKKKKKKNRAN